MKTSTLYCVLLFSLCSIDLYGQETKSNQYLYFYADGEKSTTYINLLLRNRYYGFCFVNDVRDLIYDSIIIGRKLSIIKKVPNSDCSFTYGYYRLRKKGKSIFLYYQHAETNEKLKGKQYSLQKQDSTYYTYLFSSPNVRYLSRDGRSFYLGDTVINSFGGKLYNCYKFMEKQSQLHHGISEVRIIYIDKRKLIPIRYEHLDKEDKVFSYYLISD